MSALAKHQRSSGNWVYHQSLVPVLAFQQNPFNTASSDQAFALPQLAVKCCQSRMNALGKIIKTVKEGGVDNGALAAAEKEIIGLEDSLDGARYSTDISDINVDI